MDEKVETITKPGLVKRMQITGQLSRLTIYLSVTFFAVIFAFLAILAFFEVLKPFEFSGVIIGTFVDYIVIAVIASTGVFGMYSFIRERKISKIDQRFPDFVRDMAESRRAGMTFTKAIMNASKGNYGLLTPEIQNISRQISWGNSVEKSLESFAKCVNTKLIRRTVSLIIEASRSGGNVADVLDAASKDAREIKLIDSERRAGMLSYVAVIYVGMSVFLLIILILTKSLIPSMLGEGSMGLGSVTSGSAVIESERLTQEAVLQAFYSASLVQSFGMGIVAGVFEDGNMKAGVKHAFIMVLITWVIFKFFVTGV